MGLSPTKPEFITVLADREVQLKANVTLCCEVNTANVRVNWKTDTNTLLCVHGKHTAKKQGTSLSLEILNFQEGDEGTYTVEVTNSLGSTSCSALVSFKQKKWRTMPPPEEDMETFLRNFTISKEVKELHFLLHGPSGAGKSSIINTVNSIFENRQFINCLAANVSGVSFTKKFQKFTIGSERAGRLPFAFFDVMGLEEGKNEGMHTDDIISALKGHIPEKYKFQASPMSEDNKNYIEDPTMENKIHCLVSVVPADTIKLISESVIEKMRAVRKAASELGIPQMVFMTKVDMTCPVTKQDLNQVYQSKKIRENVTKCVYNHFFL
uniref:Ig-like domain-containing protein n=1 Tax=Astyanax mexicanus TaxID=7994 RepID=A0A8B9JH05_ASTMX